MSLIKIKITYEDDIGEEISCWLEQQQKLYRASLNWISHKQYFYMNYI